MSRREWGAGRGPAAILPLVLAAALAHAEPSPLLGDLAWSRDGTRLACVIRCGGPAAPAGLWILNLEPALETLLDPAGPDSADVPAQLVTEGVEDPRTPAWSPDGATLVFSSAQDGDRELWSVPIPGGEPARLTHEPGPELSPSFTPDGSAIVLASVHGWSSVVQVMDARGENWTQISDGSAADSDPTVSPDGTRIAATSSRGGPDSILVMNLPGTGRRLLWPGTSPSWLPDARRLVYAHAGRIWEARVDGPGAPRPLCDGFRAAACPRGEVIAVLRAAPPGVTLHLRSASREVRARVVRPCPAGGRS